MKEKMKDLMAQGTGRLKKISKRRRYIIGAVVLVVLIIIITGGKKSSGEESYVVSPQTLTKTVQATGELTSDTDLALSFENAGTVGTLYARLGDNVKKGQLLAGLSAGEESTDLRNAENALASAKATLTATKSAQDILVATAYQTLLSDDLVAEPTSNDTDATPPDVRGLYAGTEEGEYKISVDGNANSLVTRAEYRVSGLESEEESHDIVLGRYLSIGTRGLSIKFPDDFAVVGYDTDWVIAIPNTKGENYASNYTAYQNAIATRDLEVARAEADVTAKEASVAAAMAVVENTVIRAPSSGKITKVDIHVGDRVEAFADAITLQDVSHLYVKANINESNIVGIHPGQTAEVTFDALSDATVFSGTVSDIDIAPTDVGDVKNYSVTILIDEPTDLLRPGMTANVTITVFSKDDALAIPRRALVPTDTGWSVRVKKDDATTLVPITIGESADGGYTEVTSGLSAGDTVVITS